MKNFKLKTIFLIFTFFFSFSSLARDIETKEELMEILKNDGFTPGGTIWLKKPLKLTDEYGKLPGLSKLTFIDADIFYKERITEKLKKGIVIFVKDSDGNEKKLILSEHLYHSPSKEMPYLLSAEVGLHKKDPSKIIKKWGKSVLMNIKNQSVQIGMTEDQVMTSIGYPNKINKNTGGWGTHEQWIYGDFPESTYLYMINGRLNAVQQSN